MANCHLDPRHRDQIPVPGGEGQRPSAAYGHPGAGRLPATLETRTAFRKLGLAPRRSEVISPSSCSPAWSSTITQIIHYQPRKIERSLRLDRKHPMDQKRTPTTKPARLIVRWSMTTAIL